MTKPPLAPKKYGGSDYSNTNSNYEYGSNRYQKSYSTFPVKESIGTSTFQNNQTENAFGQFDNDENVNRSENTSQQ